MKNYRKNTSPPNCSWFILAKQKYIAESPSLWNLKICSVYEAGLYIFATVYCGTSPTNIYKGFTYILVLFSVLFFTLFNYIGNLKLFSWCTFRTTHTMRTGSSWSIVWESNLSSLSPVRLSASVVEELQFAKRFEFSLPRKLYILTFFVNIVLSKKQSLILPIFGVQTYLIFRLKKMFFKLIRAMYKKTRKDNKEKRWKHIRKKKTKKGMEKGIK